MKRFTALALCLAFLFSLPALATISVTTARIVYTGSGSTGPFPVPFHFTDDSELTVTKISATSLATVSVLTLDVDYTVTGAGTTSGYVTLISTLSSSYKLVIQRGSDYLQSTDYEEGEAFTAATHEAALDKHTRELQEIKDASDRSLKLLPGTTDTSINVHLANPSASKAICWDSTGKALTNCSTTTVSVASMDMVSNYADFAAMIAAVGSTPTTMMVTEATAPDENSTVPCTLHLMFVNGAALTPASGVNITICSPNNILAAPDQEIFGGSGTVTFTNPGTVYADWFGPAKDGTTDDYADLNATITSVPASSTVVLGTGLHLVKTGLYVNKGINLVGNCAAKFDGGTYASTIKAGTGATGTLLQWHPANPYTGQAKIECITLDGSDIAATGLEVSQFAQLQVKNVVAFDFTGIGIYANRSTGASTYMLSFEDCWSGSNEAGTGYKVKHNGTSIGSVVSFDRCFAYYNAVGVMIAGDNSTAEHYGSTVTWSNGMVEGCAAANAACPQDGTDIGFRVKDGSNLHVYNSYTEPYGASGSSFYLSDNAYVAVFGGSPSAFYATANKFEDNSTLCQMSSGDANIYFDSYYGGQYYAGGYPETFCMGGKISGKKTSSTKGYGPPYWPQDDLLPGNAASHKGMKFRDGFGTEWTQVESTGSVDGVTGHVVFGENGRWAPTSLDARIVIPFDYTTLNAGNRWLYWAEADMVLTGVDIVVTESFTYSGDETHCNPNGIRIGTVTNRDLFIDDTVQYGGAATNLTAGAVIRAWDNNSTNAVLAWSATKRKAYVMTGVAPAYWEDNSTKMDRLYETSYVFLSPCPYTGCASCSGVWTAGKGFVILTGYNLEYN